MLNTRKPGHAVSKRRGTGFLLKKEILTKIRDLKLQLHDSHIYKSFHQIL